MDFHKGGDKSLTILRKIYSKHFSLYTHSRLQCHFVVSVHVMEIHSTSDINVAVSRVMSMFCQLTVVKQRIHSSHVYTQTHIPLNSLQNLNIE